MKQISICSQGHVSLHFGAATIHLTLDEFQQFIQDSLSFLEKQTVSSLDHSDIFQTTHTKIH